MRTVLAIVALLLVGCDCTNSVLNEVASPDGLQKAVLFDRGCGATTGHNLQISVVDARRSEGNGGNALVADLGHDTTLTRSEPRFLVRMAWVSPARLTVAYDPRLRIFRQDARVGGIEVHYEQLKQ
jgi:hypothetical protein